MSVLMETTNPAAVDQVKPATSPGVGGNVVFIPRPGEQRQGRLEFPAMVLFKHDDLTLDLLVVYGADDVGERMRIRYYTEDEPFHCWRHVEGAEPEQFEPSRLNKIRQDVTELQEQFTSLKKLVFGDWNEPPKPMIEYLVEFEAKLKELRKASSAK
jgi:hypothetical protein